MLGFVGASDQSTPDQSTKALLISNDLLSLDLGTRIEALHYVAYPSYPERGSKRFAYIHTGYIASYQR